METRKFYSPDEVNAGAGTEGQGQNSQANGTQESVKVNGIDATVFFKEDGSVEKIGVPDGLTDEQKKVWQEDKKTHEELSALASAHGKNRQSKLSLFLQLRHRFQHQEQQANR